MIKDKNTRKKNNEIFLRILCGFMFVNYAAFRFNLLAVINVNQSNN